MQHGKRYWQDGNQPGRRCAIGAARSDHASINRRLSRKSIQGSGQRCSLHPSIAAMLSGIGRPFRRCSSTLRAHAPWKAEVGRTEPHRAHRAFLAQLPPLWLEAPPQAVEEGCRKKSAGGREGQARQLERLGGSEAVVTPRRTDPQRWCRRSQWAEPTRFAPVPRFGTPGESRRPPGRTKIGSSSTPLPPASAAIS